MAKSDVLECIESHDLVTILPQERPLRRQPWPTYGQSVVYALLGNDWRPVYVGSTFDLCNRMSQHRADKAWWGEVRAVSWLRVLPGTEGRRRRASETQVIRALVPAYNRSPLIWPGEEGKHRESRRRVLARRLIDFPPPNIRPAQWLAQLRWVEALDQGAIATHSQSPVRIVMPGPVRYWPAI